MNGSTSRPSPRSETISRFILAAVSSVAMLGAGEQVLRLLGHPATAGARVAHPPHLRQVRRSLEFHYTFETNALGLRYSEIPVAKRAGERRIFVVGDSFTEGHGVDARATFAARLEAGFDRPERRVRFVNGGLSGTGPIQYGRVFVKIGLALQPDLLLICVYANDLLNVEPETQPTVLDDLTLPPPQGLKGAIWRALPRTYLAVRGAVRATPRNTLEGAIDAARRRGIGESEIRSWRDRLPRDLSEAAAKGEFNAAMLASGLFNPGHWTDALDVASPSSRRRLSAMLGVLGEICRRARKNGVAVGLIFIPVALQYDPRTHDPAIRSVWREVGVHVRPEWLRSETRIEAELRRWALSQDVPFLDLTSHFRETASTPTRLTYPLDEHWTPAGHAEAARAIGPWLHATGLVVADRQTQSPDQR